MVVWADTAERLERWLLPAECMVCRDAMAPDLDALVCALCRLRWRALPEPQCGTCGEPLVLGSECRLCAEWPRGLGPVRSSVWLDPAVRSLVHRFKYQGWSRLADAFAGRMSPLLADIGDVDLVPIPLAAKRQRARGYNQAERLALSLGALTGHPVLLDRLERRRETPSQTRLTPEARLVNLAGAFEAVHSERPAWLVDDVFTTGATLTSAALALLDAGAPAVGAVTFARAEPALSGLALRLAPFTHPSGDEEHA